MATISRRQFTAGLGASLMPWSAAIADRPRVAVVGAGLAGLAAAYELKQAGIDVSLLEQSGRVGGRIMTLRGHFAEDAWIDIGGQTSGAFYANFFFYSSSFELEFEPQQEFRQRPDYLLHLGKRLYSGAALRDGKSRWPVELHDHEKSLAPFRLLSGYLAPIAREIGAVQNVLAADFADYDRLSLRELLLQRGASTAAIELIDHTLNYNSVDTVSALSVLRDIARQLHMRGGQALNLKHGNASLTEAFASRLADEISLQHKLIAIQQSDESLTLQVETNGARQSLYADRVVLAVPFTALREVDIAPALPPGRQQIINELPYTQISQAWLQTRTRFWERDGPVSMIVSDGPLERLFDGSSKMRTERGLLVNWVNGDGANRFAAYDAEQHLDFVTKKIVAIWPAARNQIEQTYAHDWNQSYAKGAYAHYAPGQMTRFAAEIPKPDGRLHFAGEHTELVAPGMEGALTSGKRAAAEVIASLN